MASSATPHKSTAVGLISQRFVDGAYAPEPVLVDVIRLCHHLTVKGKCHHGRNGYIEQRRTEAIDGAKRGGEGSSWGEAIG